VEAVRLSVLVEHLGQEEYSAEKFTQGPGGQVCSSQHAQIAVSSSANDHETVVAGISTR
jgi:hypothetical protein